MLFNWTLFLEESDPHDAVCCIIPAPADYADGFKGHPLYGKEGVGYSEKDRSLRIRLSGPQNSFPEAVKPYAVARNQLASTLRQLSSKIAADDKRLPILLPGGASLDVQGIKICCIDDFHQNNGLKEDRVQAAFSRAVKKARNAKIFTRDHPCGPQTQVDLPLH